MNALVGGLDPGVAWMRRASHCNNHYVAEVQCRFNGHFGTRPARVWLTPAADRTSRRAADRVGSGSYMARTIGVLPVANCASTADWIGTLTAMSEALEHEIACLIVETLNLRIDPASIDPEAPLFHTGLGLDSIDALELAMVITQEYGFQFHADGSDNTRIFASLRSLSAHVEANRAG